MVVTLPFEIIKKYKHEKAVIDETEDGILLFFAKHSTQYTS